MCAIYGNVEESRSYEIGWYRRQGFYIATTVTLEATNGAVVGLKPDPGEVYFQASRRDLLAGISGRLPAGIEQRAARAELRHWVKRMPPQRADTGYRQLASHTTDRTATAPTCLHAEMGTRVLWVSAFDPEYRRVCERCHRAHLDSLATLASDREDWCDGCGGTAADVVVSVVVLDDEYVMFTSGLCPSCRAGDFPAGTGV